MPAEHPFLSEEGLGTWVDYRVVDVGNVRSDTRSILSQYVEEKGLTGQLEVIKAPNVPAPEPVALHGQPICQSDTRGCQ